MDVTAHERIRAETEQMETAIYNALAAIDAYAGVVAALLKEEKGAMQPNEMLVKRLLQFDSKAEAMTRIIEDDVLTELLFCIDRRFAVELAEDGTFI